MYHDWKIDRREGEHVYIHIWLADLECWNFGRDFCQRMARVAFLVDVVLVLVSAISVRLEEVHPCLWTSRVYVDSSRCHFGKEGSHRLDFHTPSLGVVLSQLSPFYAQEIQHPASSLPRLLCEVCRSGVGCSLSQHAKTLLWPIPPYSRPGACLTVLPVPDLLASP